MPNIPIKWAKYLSDKSLKLIFLLTISELLIFSAKHLDSRDQTASRKSLHLALKPSSRRLFLSEKLVTLDCRRNNTFQIVSTIIVVVSKTKISKMGLPLRVSLFGRKRLPMVAIRIVSAPYSHVLSSFLDENHSFAPSQLRWVLSTIDGHQDRGLDTQIWSESRIIYVYSGNVE